jgi:hypothetical protein
LWTASKNRYGYGKFSAGTRGRWIGAHRYSYGLAYGAIPDGMHVLHKCDNPACVRPDHLFLGTQRENLVDMTEKGRRYIPFSEGERNGRAKLTAQQVVEIRHRIAGGERRSAMAKIYGVCLSSINNIVWGKTWRTDKGGWGNDKSTPVKVKHEA